MGYDKGEATREFTRWSESYDRSILQWLLFGPSHRAIIAPDQGRVRRPAGPGPRRRLRDRACSPSRIREALPNAQVIGIDLVAGMLAKGSDRWKRQRRRRLPGPGRQRAAPVRPGGTFDIVTCANSFHHYPHQDRAVDEMRRVLKPGGRLMLVDGYRDRPLRLDDLRRLRRGGRGGRPPRLRRPVSVRLFAGARASGPMTPD